MKMMQFSLHLVILFVAFSCKAEVNQTDFDGLNSETISTYIKNSSDVQSYSFGDKNSIHVSKNRNLLIKQGSRTTESTRMTTVTHKMAPLTTGTEQSSKTHTMNIISNNRCTWKEEKYKTGIMICIIIIALLVLICAVLIICSVALANKISRLKKKLTQTKRQARSNGDFLSASSILWPTGMETWQRKAQAAMETMDEIALGDTSNSSDDEKHKLMATQALEKSIETKMEDKTTDSTTDEIITTVSTVEV
ncbi:protein EVI2A [Pseudophryne corroboree]|uniref:protein EVI2A n=1 Tax=Pseudophryne corroboree TaxID=495146 RepID=UPI0030821222